MASRSLGTLTLDMLVKMGGFVQGMNQAQRVTDQRTKEMQKSLQNLESSFKGIGSAVTSLAAAVGVGLSFRNIIQQTVNFQKEQAQLEAVLLSTGRAAEINKQQLNDMARSLAATGGGSLFSEGEINQAQARLLSYTGIVGDQFPAAMQAAIDMATRLGMDVSSAAETVGRALDVPSQGLTALTRQGFRFTDEQKKLVQELERTGRTAEAQKIILGQLTSAYGGAAAAARDTLGGALAALRENFNSLFTDASGGDQLKSFIDSINSVLSSDAVKSFAQGTLIALQAALPVATAYVTLWGGSKAVTMVKNMIAADSASIRMAQSNLVASQQALVRAQQETALAAKIALSAQGTNAQTVAVLNLVKARQAEVAATAAVATATSKLNLATSAVGKIFNLFGGWVGIASIALGVGVSALMSYRDKTVEVKETIIDLSKPLAEVTEQFKQLSLVQQQAEIATISNNQIANAQKMVETLREMEDASDAGFGKSMFTLSADAKDANREMHLLVAELTNVNLPYQEWSEKLQRYIALVNESTWLTDEQKNSALSFAGAADKLRNSIDDGNASLDTLVNLLRRSKTEMDAAGRAALAMDQSLASWMDRYATSAQRASTERTQAQWQALTQFGSSPQHYLEASKQLNAYFSDKNRGSGGSTDYARRWLEESQKAIQNSLQDFERDYARSMSAIEQMNEDGLVSLSGFYDAQRSLLESQGQERVNAIDQQIAALQQYRAAAKNEAESYRATQQINDLYRQRIQIIEDNVTAINKLGRDEVKALAELESKFRQVDLSLMEHRGLVVEVAAIRFDDQYADLLKLAQANDRLDIVKKIEEFKQLELQATAFGKEAQNLQNILGSLSNAEQMLSVTQQLGGVGEIAALRQLGNLRSGQLEAVNASLANLREILNTGESTPELVRQLEQLELQAAQLQAGLDPLAAKFADVFSKGMEDPIYDFISGTKTAAEAFTEMANQIIADLARLAIQDSLTSLFSGSSSGGGIFGFISGLFANAKGGTYSGPGISAYSNSVVSKPTLFPFAKGVGLMGEAGDEAIMPLTRTGNGDLGVKAVGQQLSEKAAGEQAFNTNIVINMADGGASTTVSRDNQDAQARILAQSVDRAVKDCISREMMQGGVIWKMRNGR